MSGIRAARRRKRTPEGSSRHACRALICANPRLRAEGFQDTAQAGDRRPYGRPSPGTACAQTPLRALSFLPCNGRRNHAFYRAGLPRICDPLFGPSRRLKAAPFRIPDGGLNARAELTYSLAGGAEVMAPNDPSEQNGAKCGSRGEASPSSRNAGSRRRCCKHPRRGCRGWLSRLGCQLVHHHPVADKQHSKKNKTQERLRDHC